jgi:hypothetical protein
MSGSTRPSSVSATSDLRIATSCLLNERSSASVSTNPSARHNDLTTSSIDADLRGQVVDGQLRLAREHDRIDREQLGCAAGFGRVDRLRWRAQRLEDLANGSRSSSDGTWPRGQATDRQRRGPSSLHTTMNRPDDRSMSQDVANGPVGSMQVDARVGHEGNGASISTTSPSGTGSAIPTSPPSTASTCTSTNRRSSRSSDHPAVARRRC